MLSEREVDGGYVGGLILLDLPAAFDTVDHVILLRQLQTSIGLKGPVFNWFQTYRLPGLIRCSMLAVFLPDLHPFGSSAVFLRVLCSA